MAAEFTGLKALTSVLGWKSLACVCMANSTGSNLLVASTIWFTNGVLLITVEHSGLRVIIYLQAVGTEGNFRVQRRSVTVWSSVARNPHFHHIPPAYPEVAMRICDQKGVTELTVSIERSEN